MKIQLKVVQAAGAVALFVLSLCVLPIVSFAQRSIGLGLPHDDLSARRDVYSWVQLKPFALEYDQLITRIRALRGDDIAKVFGPRLAQRNLITLGDPTNSVAPLFAPYGLWFSGLLDKGDKSHRDLSAVGELGCVEFFYELDASPKTAVLYARLDEKFVPLQSTNDFSRRLEWDKAKFDAIKRWLGAHFDGERTGEPGGQANGRQPVGSETNRTSAAAASRRSP